MKKLFWVDLEMTGLNENTDHILEVAIVITDLNFKPLEEFHRVVFQPHEIIDKMDEWCKKTHRESGLTSLVPQGFPLSSVEAEILQLIDRHFTPQERIVLVGNSVGNDKHFLDKQMLNLAKRLHYRIVDVSSYKEIFQAKYNLTFKKANSHRAVDDVYESIRELAFYLSHFTVPQTSQSTL